MRGNSLTVVAAILAAVLISGCSRPKTREVNILGGKAVISTEQKTITQAELGVPVYPGATVQTTGDFSGIAGMDANARQTTLVSTDPFERVSEFYRTNLPYASSSGPQNVGQGMMSMFTGKGVDGTDMMVMIASDKQTNQTMICVMKVQGTGQ